MNANTDPAVSAFTNKTAVTTPSFSRGSARPIDEKDARELFIYQEAPQEGVVREFVGTYSVSVGKFKLPELMKLVADHSKVENWNVAIMTVGKEHGFKMIEYRLPRDPGSPIETFRAAMDMAAKRDVARIYVHPVAERQT